MKGNQIDQTVTAVTAVDTEVAVSIPAHTKYVDIRTNDATAALRYSVYSGNVGPATGAWIPIPNGQGFATPIATTGPLEVYVASDTAPVDVILTYTH